MDLPENNDATDKSWDHPWTTDEMRQHQNDWSLAADAELLKHLQQFSDNLTQQFSKTEEKLNSLSSDLEEASVIIDNITNTSLALANTQFIESRVHEDEIETEHSQSTQESSAGKEEPYKDDLIACVSESIKQGLSILDEKFERLEVLASDSEDEGEVPVPSVVLKPKDPYQNRPLPYVIGSEKWKTSSKVGLESSSSDSESPEAEKDSGSESEEEIRQSVAIPSINRHESIRRSLSSSSSSELSGRNDQTNPTKDYSSVSLRNDKLAARSQDTLNSGSELATPSIAESRTENSSKAAPSFAEELAKRLGKVLPSEQRSVRDHQDADQSSINRYKDDLFAPEDNDVFANKSENLFSDNSNLFDEDVSKSLWKNKPYKPPISNIIPPSLDVPPPMNTEAMKPKSAFDDLCGDPESEDSDNIFAPKSSFLSEPSKPRSSSEDKHENSDLRENKFLNVALGENASKMATSTPELNDNGGLFGDDDDDVLFGNSTRSQSRISEKTPELVPPRNRQALPGLSITQADILGSNLGSRLFQRVPRQGSSDSSDSESPVQNPDGRSNDRIVQESDSSGISIRPNNNTANNTLGPDFQPQWESTRLKSEEIYRERFPSDSLFEGRGRNAESTNSIDNSSLREHNEGRFIGETLESGREENLDTDDVFGPPPLPKHNDSKSKSNDDLFSNSSSESRSHKSFDLPAAGESQYDVKITSDRGGGGLFDEDIDIFGSGDAPQIDIFGEAFNPSNFVSRGSSHQPVTQDESSASKVNNSSSNKIDSLTEKIEENPKVSTKSGFFQESLVKSTSIFDDSEDDNDDDLFAPSFLKSNRAPRKIMLETEDDEIFTNKPTRNTGSTTLSETKKESTSSLVGEKVANATSAEREIAKRDSDDPATEKRLPSFSNSGLFDNLDEKNVDDGLFASDVSNDEGTNEKPEDKLLADVGSSGDSKNEEFATNRAKFEDMLKGQSTDESSTKKSPPKETDFDYLPKKITPETSPLKRDDSPKKFIDDDRETSSTDGGKISKASNSPELIGDSTKRHPPETLSIRLPVASDDSSQPPPRRVVSDKIKHLKGKMGDFKVLSPTDTPPVWRKSKEKTDSESEKTESRDIEDGGNMSVPSTAASPTLSPTKNIDQLVETSDEIAQNSPPDDSGNSESAVSFDVPAQVEVLAVTASKSRARIQAKRRPQSRHARHSALRKSGIDFDTVDNTGSEAVESDPSGNRFSGISDKISTVGGDSGGPESSRTDRLGGKESEGEKLPEKMIVETNCSLAPEDRSEMSFSKGSSLSLNKNTLLSPSTDEEDLFDVPPDLPEDPPKEDTLFGRAPILSPIDRSLGRKTGRSKDKPREKPSNIESEENLRMPETKKSSEEGSKREKSSVSESTAGDKPIDPLRDNSHDPLKDPSQLFAFVTKTPSPEKGQNVLFKEDASLFTHLAKKAAEEAKSKRAVLDLFADDNAGDLFTETLAKSTKKPIRAVKSDSLFDEVDNTDEDFATNLFGARSKTAPEKSGKMEDSVVTKSNETSGRASPERGSIFASTDADDLFVNLPPKKVSPEPEKRVENKEKNTKETSSKTRDIFGDESSGEEDLFTKSKSIASGKGVTASSSIFSAGPDDDDADDIFGTKTSSKSAKHEPTENRPTLKKAVTRDLKKTAETIVQDPLSMLQDD